MNKLINIVLSGLLWRRYKFLIVTLIILIVIIFLVGKVHDDFLSYAQNAETAMSIGTSFLIKWGAWCIALLSFVLANHVANTRKETKRINEGNNKSLKNIINKKLKKLSTQIPDTSPQKYHTEGLSENMQTENKDDPFYHVRNKPRLRSYADMIIEKHEDKK